MSGEALLERPSRRSSPRICPCLSMDAAGGDFVALAAALDMELRIIHNAARNPPTSYNYETMGSELVHMHVRAPVLSAKMRHAGPGTPQRGEHNKDTWMTAQQGAL